MFQKTNDPSACCDLCGEKPRDGCLYTDERCLCVCWRCRRKLEEMPRRSRENLENYLIGNVI